MKGIHQQREKLPSSNEPPSIPWSFNSLLLFVCVCVCALLRHLLDCQFSTRCPEISGCYCYYGDHYYVRSFQKKKNESSKLAQRKNADNRRMLTRWNNRPEKEEESANSPLLKKVTLAEEMFRVIPLNVCSQHEGCVQQQQVFLYIHPPAR